MNDYELETEDPTFRKAFGNIWTGLGILVATLSLSSLIHRWGDVPLVELMSDILASYRSVADEAKRLLFDWWIARIWPEWQLPNWAFDLLTVWMMSGMSAYRGSDEAAMRGDWRRKYKRARLFYDIILGPISWMFSIQSHIRKLMRAAIMIYTHESLADVKRSEARRTLLQIILSTSPILVATAFFTWNGLAL